MVYFATPGNADDAEVLIGDHPAEVESMVASGTLDAGARLTMQIRFKPRNPAALNKLLTEQI
ncbi:MAG TPA: hypothetical protein VKR29_12665, partial [Candidatus Binataceae bacterium]|nr:hypothetical protein [Candidatus Binataceae bacterium]